MKYRKTDAYIWLHTKNGYYYAVYTDEKGKSRRTSLTTKDPKEAQRRFNAWRRDFLIAWGNQPDPKESTINVATFLEEWVTHISTRHPHSTLIQYQATANKLIRSYGSQPVKDLSFRTVKSFIDELLREGLSAPTVNKHRRHLRIILNAAEEWGYINRRPKLDKPIHEKERLKYFTEAELKMLFAAIADPEFKDFCLLALLSALRSGELLRLTAADINSPPGYIRISEAQKNRTESRIPLTSAIAPIVEKLSTMRPAGSLFPYKSPSYISRRFKRYLELAGISGEHSFHSLRHTYGTTMVAKGVELIALKELMRHKSIASTMIYAKVIPAHLIKAGELMQFDPSDTL